MVCGFNNVFIRTAGVAALSIIAIASCTRIKEQAKEQAAVPAEQLPALSTSAGLDTAMAKAHGLMLVLDFYADWCKPCRFLAPVIDGLAGEYKGKADFYRVNIDKSADLAGAFGVRGIPLVVFMKNGRVVYALTGVNPKEYYAAILSLCEGPGSADDCIRQLKEKM